jgi:2-dehydropantoate 2-reductase
MTMDLRNVLNTETIQCDFAANVMDRKHGKLLLNVGNAVAAALGSEARHGSWYKRARSEAEAVYRAAGISHDSVDFDDPRREIMQRVPIEGVKSAGGSSVQSLMRETGSIETDFLNGEIVLLGRLHGVDTPVNAALMRVADKMARARMAPGEFPETELERLANAS